MHNYTSTNLPDGYREFFLRSLAKDEPIKYPIAHRKAKEALDNAIKKTLQTNAACVNLRIMEDNYINALIKFYKTDEAIDEEYKKGNVTYNDIIDSLDENKKDEARDELQVCLFAIDLLDTHIRKVQQYIRMVFPEGGDDNMFSPILKLSKRCNDTLMAFHNEQTIQFEEQFADEAERIDEYLTHRAGVYRRKLKRTK